MSWRHAVVEAEPVVVMVECLVETEIHDGDSDLAERVLRQAVAMQRADLPTACSAVAISVLLTDDEAIAAINTAHRAIDAPTDVLSFPQYDDIARASPLVEGLPLQLGDIVVSVPRAEEQARMYGHSREREICFLLVHGFLHLLGYDHQDDDGREHMEERQRIILGAVGLTRDGGPA